MTRDRVAETRLNLVFDELVLERAKSTRLGLANERLRDEFRQLGDDYATLRYLASAQTHPTEQGDHA
jgi:hypothetical protein